MLQSDTQNLDLTVVVPSFNNADSLIDAMESLLGQVATQDFSYEILVVDNNSSDATEELVRKYEKKSQGRIKYVFEPEQGLSSARNKGIAQAKGEYVAFTDSDCVVDRRWMSEIMSAFRKFNADAVQGKIQLATVVPETLWYPDWFIKQRMASVDYSPESFVMGDQNMVGANMSFKKEIFDRFGGFDPRVNFLYCEDTEFSSRISKGNVKKVYNPDAVVNHYYHINRLQDSKFFKQSFFWGRGSVIFDNAGIPPIRHLLYCSKEIIKNYFICFFDLLRNDKQSAFFINCRISSYCGQWYELLMNILKRP